MRDSRASGKKPINEVEKLCARVAILESENRKLTKCSSADEELGKAWAEWEKTFDGARDSIMVIDSEFKIIQANLATSRLLGKPVDEIVGQTCWQVVHGTEEPPEKCPLKEALYSKNHEEMELHVPEKDIWIEVSTDPILDDQGNINRAIHIIRDITERKLAEVALKDHERELSIRNRIANIFLTIPDEKMYAEVLDVILEVLASEFGTFGYFDDGGNFVCPALTRTIYWEKCNVPDKEVVFERGQFAGIWGRAVKERKVLYCNTGPFDTPKGHIPIENTMVAPIVYRDEIISAIHIANKPGGYDEKDCALLKTVTKHMAPILNARLERDRKEKERKNAENRIREQREFLRSTIESLSHPFYVIDANDYTIQMANSALGSVISTVGVTCHALTHRSDRPCESPEHICPVKRIKETKRSLVVEHVHLDENGNERIVEVHAHPIFDSQDNVVSIIEYCLDISERKKAEENLRESRDYLERLTNSMWDAVFSVKMPERIIEWVNDSFRLTGYEPRECIGKSTEFLYPDKNEFLDFSNKLKRTIEAGKDILHAEQLLKRKNGEIFPAEITTTIFKEKGLVVTVTSIVRDITERKKAEEEIERLAKFPAEDPYPVLRISGHGTVIYANKASAPLLKAWGCRVGESLPDRWHEFALDALSSGQSQRAEVECDGRIFFLTFAPVTDANYVNVYGLDITERKEAERELLGYQAKLKSSTSELSLAEERERRRIADGIHDDIGNRLAVAKLELQSLKKGPADSEIPALLERVSATMDKVIEDARSLTFELSNPVLYEVGLDAAIESWLDRHIHKKSRLKYEVVSEPSPLKGDVEISVVLFGIIRELLTNVVKHADASMVQVHVKKDDETIRVSIEDDGVGFKLSKPGLPVKEAGGFGLFNTRERVEYVGGSFEIESEPGQGTFIKISVPVQESTSR